MLDRRPTLVTHRLVLRPPAREDAPHVQRLAGAREIAANTATIPHPYPDGAAEAWIEQAALELAEGRGATFMALRRQGAVVVGTVGLRIEPQHRRAELGYWIGVPYWGQGFATEAAEAVVRYGFEELGLHRVFATHYRRNPASGRVLEKLGMSYEGRMRSHVLKWETFEDLECYGMLLSDWRLRQGVRTSNPPPE
jgi:RimJ/RimL family protein N-acetyltransferase